MEVFVLKDYEEVSKKAFEVMKSVVSAKPDAVLGLATGSTPLGLYRNMIQDHQENQTSYAQCQSFNLDEYVGLPRDHKESYYTFMHTNLFSGIDIKEENVHLPYGDSKADCEAYEKAMENVHVDIQYNERKLNKILNSVDRLGISYVLVLGSDEVESGIITLKCFKDGSNYEFKISDYDEIASFIQNNER